MLVRQAWDARERDAGGTAPWGRNVGVAEGCGGGGGRNALALSVGGAGGRKMAGEGEVQSLRRGERLSLCAVCAPAAISACPHSTAAVRNGPSRLPSQSRRHKRVRHKKGGKGGGRTSRFGGLHNRVKHRGGVEQGKLGSSLWWADRAGRLGSQYSMPFGSFWRVSLTGGRRSVAGRGKPCLCIQHVRSSYAAAPGP